MTSRNWFFTHTSHAIAELFRRRSASRSGRARRERPTLASLVSETLEPRSMMAVTPPSISIDDVLDLTDGDHRLTILGEAGDTLTLTGDGGHSWTVTDQGADFTTYSYNDGIHQAVVEVSNQMAQTIV